MTDAVYNDEDWSPPGAKAAPAMPTPAPVEQAPAKIDAATGRPTITVHPRQKPPDVGVYSDEDWKPSAERRPYREVGPGEAAARGFMNIETYGLAPALYGAGAAGAAGKTPEEQNAMIVPGTDYPGGEMVGAGLHGLWAGKPQAHEAYNQGSQSFLGSDQLAQEQHLVPYILGQVTAALSAPETLAGGMMRTGLSKFLPQLLKIAGASGVRSAAQSAGETISEGRPEDVPLEAAKGLGAGVALGALGGAATEGLGAAASKVGTIVRGYRDPEAEAGQKIVNALRSDVKQFGPSMTPEETAAAQTAGTERAIVDYGGERTRALARSSANTSPEGRQALEDLARRRFEQQSPRIAGHIRRMTGVSDATTEQDSIDAAKAAFNPPMYKRAYAAGDRPIWSDETSARPGAISLKELTGDDDVQKAMAKAAKTGKSWAILDGMGSYPSVAVNEDGSILMRKGPTGIPTYPNVQYWDYVQRELKGMINAAKGKNESSDVTRLTGLRNAMLKELDAQVPEFGQARQTAASFFGAEDALEAGQKFVMGNQDIGQARRALAAMKPIEKDLFARGFASDLAAKIESVPDNQDVINKAFLNSHAARAKIDMALGSDRANELEALLRSEKVIDKMRKALGNSTTARQVSEMGMAGAGAAGAAESLKHTTFAGLLLSGLGVHKGQKFLAGIDEKVAQKVGEMLASDDPAQLQRGIQIIAKSPTWMKVLRRATGAGARVGSPDVGFPAVAAAGAMAGEDMGDIFKKKEHEPHPREAEPVYQDNAQ